MASMPARWSRAVVVVAAAAAGLCACEPQVNIAIVRAEDLGELPIGFVRFVFRPAGLDPVQRGPFSIAGIPGDDFAEVPPDTEFSVDVIGCKELDGTQCETEDTFIARGCAGGFIRGRDEALSITVELHAVNVGNELCPVEDPLSDLPVAEGEGEGE